VTKLIYIGGYGHSGSTLLEYLLAASPDIVACGEVSSVLRQRGRKEDCTCGQPAIACPVWGRLQQNPAALDGWSHQRLALALLDESRGRYAAMVDSSKTPWNALRAPFHLRRALGEDFVLLHLTRDPRAVSWSAVTKAGRQGTRPLTALRASGAALGWTASNLACEAFGRAYPDQYLRLRYEDLVSAPSAVMQSLVTKLLPGVSWDAQGIGDNANRHQLYGNRMRARRLSLAEIKEDSAWRREMPSAARALAAGLTWPLRERYGYR
jgi:Sulfotransferase family